MKYLKIINQGELDVRLIFLMGGTTKSNDDTKIGTHGTGLKYAISYFLRHGIDFRLFSGTNEIIFNVEQNNIADNSFNEIYCNGKTMNITTHYGHQWQAWEAIREVWCNAKDEGSEKVNKTKEDAVIEGVEGFTTFYIEANKEINHVHTHWKDYFLKDVPVFENEEVAIYPNNGEYLKLYKNGVLIENQELYKSLFNYDLKKAELNELRQYRGYARSDIGKALLSSNKAVIDAVIASIKDENSNDLYEVKLDWDYLPHDKAKVKKIFSGYLFLHPDSDVSLSGRSVKVSLSLFNLLQKAGLSTEKINKSVGGCWGGIGSGYKENGEVKYKKIDLPELTASIQSIFDKYKVKKEFIIAIPKKSKFEVLTTYQQIIFSSELENLNAKDLEATVLVGIFNSQDGNFYKAFKRLIKFVMDKSYFRALLFGNGKELMKDESYVGDDILPF